MIALVTGKHFIDTFLLLWRPGVMNSLGLSGIYAVIPNSFVVVAILFFSSSVALWGLLFANNLRSRLSSVVLQQLLLLFMAGGAIAAVIAGKYADTYSPSGGGAFILADQMPRIILVAIHALAIYKYSLT